MDYSGKSELELIEHHNQLVYEIEFGLHLSEQLAQLITNKNVIENELNNLDQSLHVEIKKHAMIRVIDLAIQEIQLSKQPTNEHFNSHLFGEIIQDLRSAFNSKNGEYDVPNNYSIPNRDFDISSLIDILNNFKQNLENEPNIKYPQLSRIYTKLVEGIRDLSIKNNRLE